jgi:hypothetical protein
MTKPKHAAAGQSASGVAAIVAHEMNRLWQAHGIIELVVHAIGDEIDNGAPSIKAPLRSAADVIWESIKALEPICVPAKVQL